MSFFYDFTLRLLSIYSADSSYTAFVGYLLRQVTNQMVLWEGHCVRGCCIGAKAAHFKISLFYRTNGEYQPRPIIGLFLDIRVYQMSENGE